MGNVNIAYAAVTTVVWVLACQTGPSRVPVPTEAPPPPTQARVNAAPQRSEAPREPFPLAEIAKRPGPGWAVPRHIEFSPDGQVVTFLHSADASLTQQLYVLDLQSGQSRVLFDAGDGDTEDNLSHEQKLMRERLRMLATGVTNYAWSKEGSKLLVPVGSELLLLDDLGAAPRSLLPKQDQVPLEPQLSRDGNRVAFVLGDEIHFVGTTGGTPRQLTRGPKGRGKYRGRAEFVAAEEMLRRAGFWWSHDGAYLAFTDVDESHIPVYPIVHSGQAAGEVRVEEHAFPFAGAKNAKVRLGVVATQGGSPRWLKLDDHDDHYIARAEWMADGKLWIQTQTRDQKTLRLLRVDPRTGNSDELLRERADHWLNLNDDLRHLDKAQGDAAGGFLWASERNGYKHLYLYSSGGKLLRQLTSGDWMVDYVVQVDQQAGSVYFIGTRDGATESHLYRVPLQGGGLTRLTTEPGRHHAIIDEQCEHFVDVHSSLMNPPSTVVRRLSDGAQVAVIQKQEASELTPYPLEPPQLTSIRSRDGVALNAAIYRPPPQFAGPHPVVVLAYGGPLAQLVSNGWSMTSDLRAQYLRSLGYLVFKLDNRGSARRGVEFEKVVLENLGDLEVRDQEDGVRWLVENENADPQRVAIMGWSYGGYLSAMALLRAPETFQVAVAGAPVSHWDGYDTHYTERYMGTPQGKPEAYTQSSLLAHANALRGDLLIVHGMLDENVHFRHSARLINALTQAQKPYELLLFPDERHLPRSEADRVYMEQRILDFLKRKL